MSLLFVESFDRLGSLSPRWDGAGATLGSFGRNGTNGARCSGDGGILTKHLPVQATTLILGMAVLLEGIQGHRLATFSNANGDQVLVNINVDGELTVYRGDTSTVLGRSLRSMRASVYHYLEIKVTIGDGLLGNVLIRLNGDPFFDLTALDTNADTTGLFGWVGSIAIGGTSVSAFRVDDVYVCDDQGGVFDDFLGDVTLCATHPTADGNYTDFAIAGSSPPANAFEAVDESAPNDTTDYLAATAAGARETFAMSDLPLSNGDVLAYSVTARHRAAGAGTRELGGLARLGGADLSSPATEWTSVDWWASQFLLPEKPGGGAWSIDDVNNAELGLGLVT